MVPVPATPTGRNFQTTRPHARRPEPSLPTCRGTIATAILGVWVAHLMFDLPVLQVDKTSVRVGSIVRGICRDLRSIVDCLGMCRSHTRRYTIRRRALYHGGILVHGVNFICQSSRHDCPLILGYVCGDRPDRCFRFHHCANGGDAVGRGRRPMALADVVSALPDN